VTYDLRRNILATRFLEISADLRAALRQAIEQCEADGRTVENDGAYGFFFCNRAGERREIRLQPTDPTNPVPLR
jgi:hypothetical protein